MWSSSGGKKEKQPLMRANEKAKEITTYHLFICYYHEITIYYSINMLRKMAQTDLPR